MKQDDVGCSVSNPDAIDEGRLFHDSTHTGILTAALRIYMAVGIIEMQYRKVLAK